LDSPQPPVRSVKLQMKKNRTEPRWIDPVFAEGKSNEVHLHGGGGGVARTEVGDRR